MTDEYLHLRAAHKAGCRIQSWTLNDGATGSNDGYWRIVGNPRVDPAIEPRFTCPAHLYQIFPDDLGLLPTEPSPDREDAERFATKLIADVKANLESMDMPKMTEARAEYWKAGARAAIAVFNRTLNAARQEQAS